MITLSAIVCSLFSKSGSVVNGRAVATQSAKAMSEKDFNKPTIIFVLGGPGAGKGTQCANLVQVTNLLSVKTNDY